MLKRFVMNRSGASAVEYGLIAGVLSLAILAGIGTATNAVQFLLSNNSSKLQQAIQSVE